MMERGGIGKAQRERNGKTAPSPLQSTMGRGLSEQWGLIWDIPVGGPFLLGPTHTKYSACSATHKLWQLEIVDGDINEDITANFF